jgi:hypothetical protein
LTVEESWDDDQHRVIRYDFSGAWTWDELYEAFDRAKVLIAGQPHTVYFICNFLPDSQRVLDFRLDNLTQIRNLVARVKAGSVIIIVNGGLYNRLLYAVFARIYPQLAAHFKYVNTLDAAREHLQQIIAAEQDGRIDPDSE